MKNCLKKMNFAVGAAFGVAASCLVLAQPAHAGAWTLTASVTGGYSAGNVGSGPSIQSSSNSYAYTNFGFMSYTNIPLVGNFTYTGTIQWSGSGTQPSTVTLTESNEVYGECNYTSLPAKDTAANDGLGDAPVTSTYTGYPGDAQSTTSEGSHTTVITVPAGGSYTYTRTFSNEAYGTGLEEALVSYSASVK